MGVWPIYRSKVITPEVLKALFCWENSFSSAFHRRMIVSHRLTKLAFVKFRCLFIY